MNMEQYEAESKRLSAFFMGEEVAGRARATIQAAEAGAEAAQG